MFSQTQVDEFNHQGFIIERGLGSPEMCERMDRVIRESLDPPLAPLEFETDVQYPGSPKDRLSPGGNTPRRLLNAYTRDAVFREWATSDAVADRVRQLLGSHRIYMSQNHHNCIMTKHPGYSSATLWHQDIRYWLFDKPELVSVWLALGTERPENGGMLLIPGSHTANLERGRFDAAQFLRQNLEENQALISSCITAEMERGDVLFFHARTIHAAGKNQTGVVKTAVVFTYHDSDNQPLVDTRSSAFPDIPCQPEG